MLNQCLEWLGHEQQWWWSLVVWCALVTTSAVVWMIRDEIRFRRHRREVLNRLNQIARKRKSNG